MIMDAINKRLPTILRTAILLQIIFILFTAFYTFYAIFRFEEDFWIRYPSFSFLLLVAENVLAATFSVVLFLIIKLSQRERYPEKREAEDSDQQGAAPREIVVSEARHQPEQAIPAVSQMNEVAITHAEQQMNSETERGSDIADEGEKLV